MAQKTINGFNVTAFILMSRRNSGKNKIHRGKLIEQHERLGQKATFNVYASGSKIVCVPACVCMCGARRARERERAKTVSPECHTKMLFNVISISIPIKSKRLKLSLINSFNVIARTAYDCDTFVVPRVIFFFFLSFVCVFGLLLLLLLTV